MSVHHDREALLAEIRNMPDGCFADGVLIDVPKRRRREQAMQGIVRIRLPKEQNKRLATQFNRYIEACGKDLGIEILLVRLELPSEAEIRNLCEGVE